MIENRPDEMKDQVDEMRMFHMVKIEEGIEPVHAMVQEMSLRIRGSMAEEMRAEHILEEAEEGQG